MSLYSRCHTTRYLSVDRYFARTCMHAPLNSPQPIAAGALYHSSSLPCPLRSFVSIGRTTSNAATAAAAPPAARAPAPEASAVSGMLPTFSPVFTNFGRHTSLESVRSQPIAIPAADVRPPHRAPLRRALASS